MDKKLKKMYKRQVLDLLNLANKHDPAGLLLSEDGRGAPDDEYSCEVADILCGLKSCSSPSNAINLVATTFEDAFEFGQEPSEYTALADEIWKWWKNEADKNLPYERDKSFLEQEAWKPNE